MRAKWAQLAQRSAQRKEGDRWRCHRSPLRTHSDGPSSGHQATPEAVSNSLRPIPHAELAEQPAGVSLDSVLRQVQLPPDLAVALTLAHSAENLELALG